MLAALTLRDWSRIAALPVSCVTLSVTMTLQRQRGIGPIEYNVAIVERRNAMTTLALDLDSKQIWCHSVVQPFLPMDCMPIAAGGSQRRR